MAGRFLPPRHRLAGGGAGEGGRVVSTVIPDDAPCASIRNLEMFSTPHLGIPGSMLAHRPGMTGEIAQARATCTVVMRGFDPRIHQPSQKHFRSGWIAGSSPAMTT